MKRRILLMVLPLAFAACNKEDSLDIQPSETLGGEVIKPTAIDQWLRDSLTTPYNIAVKYRWDPWELNLDRTLTPPQEDKIIPAMSAIKRVWIDPYNAETGSDLFMKQFTPKQFKLVGSVEYNYNGTVVLGQAEGGNNIAFFDINQNFDGDPVTSIKRMIHTAHHEFAHILHQNVLYPQEFKGISARLGMAGYTGTWFNVEEADAYANGYITPYAMSNYDDDFAEMVSVMLAEGRENFDTIVNRQNETAQDALRQKEQFVVNYFREVWNIDFYSLQTRVQNALGDVVKVEDVFNYNKQYPAASVTVDDQDFMPQTAAFVEMFETAAANLAALADPYQLDSFQVVSADPTTMILVFSMTKDGQPVQGLFGFDDVVGANGNHTYTLYGADPVGEEILDAVLDILLYFNEREFGLSWYASPAASAAPRVKFTPVDNANDYFIARLIP